MCIGSKPSIPKAAPVVQAAPQEQDQAVVDARDEETRRRRAAGRNSTMLTGAQGDTSAASTSGKTLLGQ